jgi:Alw26I/Eco31I/Esp3I family type II restriction m6 adenine DNA methyltransferase
MKVNPAVNVAKKIYSTYDLLSTNRFSDKEIIQNLLALLKTNKPSNNLTFLTLLSDFYSSKQAKYIDIIELIGLTHQKSKEKVLISDTDFRKHNGIYYTNYLIAKQLAQDVISLYGNSFDPTKLTFLEPCSGIGIFALAYLDSIFEKNFNLIKQTQQILNNMFFADIDVDAINLLKTIIPAYLKSKYKIEVKLPEQNVYIGNVLFKFNKGQVVKNNLNSIFNKKEGFDIVLTNPPYKLLKANSNKYNEGTDYKEQITKILSYIRKNNVYRYNFGTLNLYKLFVEEILENYTSYDGKVGILIPATLLSDKQSFELRNRILDKYALSTLYTIPEKNNFFLDITQAFCFFALDKSKTNTDFELKTDIFDIADLNKKNTQISKSRINSISSFQEIISTDQMGWRILSKLHKNKKLKEIPSITNLRGELDLTLDKKFITNEGTEYKLLRGNGIKEFSFIEDNLYVHNNFINKLNGKARYLTSDRLVCQQISNLNLRKRLKFSKVPKNIVLGNSCNFIVTNSDSLFSDINISMDYLLGLLNSLLLNWRFQLTSSNNHIGNYQLDELPIAVPDSKQKSVIEDMSNKLVQNPNNEEYKARLNGLIFDVYGLDKEEKLYILESYKNIEIAELTKKWLQL